MIDFGKDTSCTDSLRTGRFSTGPRLVAEACYRRLITPRGSLRGGEDEANYGFDLSEKIGTVVNASTEAALPGQIQSELLKDERLSSVTVNVVSTKTGPAVAWVVTIEGQTSAGPFTLKLSVSEVTVSILGLQVG